MFDYLQKFNNLPSELREKVSSPAVMATLADLERKYQIDLAIIVMKVMVKMLEVKNLNSYFIGELGLSQSTAENLTKELTEKIFISVADYLGITKEVKALDLDSNIDLIIREVGLVLPSSDLITRFKTIISTYLKGIRSKVSARDAFAKPVNLGGLSLSSSEIDRLFKVCEQKTFSSLEVKAPEVNKIANPLNRLDQIIASAEMGTEYNLKQAIALGQIKKPEHIYKANILDTKHEIESPAKELDLPAPAKELDLPLPQKKAEVPAAPIKPVVPVKPGSATPPAPIKPVTKSAPKQSIFSKLKGIFSKPKVAKVAPVAAVVATAVGSVPKVAAAAIATKVVAPAPTPAPVKKIEPIKQNAPITPVKPITPISQVTPVKPTPQNIPVKPVAPIKPIVPPTKSSLGPIAASRPALVSSNSKQAMHDIKPIPKVMGPLEELQFLDLLNFRRLGKTPDEITAKIFSKIKLLEVDGYDKMVAGVQAWRQSPVNHLYLKMMKEAINKGLTIKDYAVLMEKESKDYLSLIEIEAIILMNSKLIF